MSILEINWDQKRPSDEEIQQVLKDIKLEQVPITNTSINELLEAFNKSFKNGKSNIVCCRIPENDILDWFLARNRSEDYDIYQFILKEGWQLPLLTDKEVSNRYGQGKKKERGSSFTLSGQIAQSLFQGGAYSGFKGTGKDAFEIAEKFRKAIFNDRYNEIFIFVLYGPWTTWFSGVAWDISWFILDKKNRLIWLLSVTDTD